MTNSQNKYSAAIVALLFVNILLFTSCKDKNNVEDVEFDLSIAESDIIPIDSIIDSTTSATEKFYKISINIINDYYRVACEENNVLLDDVQSVTLKSSTAEFINPASGSFAEFKNIRQYAHDNGLASTDLMASAESITGTPVNLTLTPTTNDLKKYFRLQYLPTQILLGQQSAGFSGADVKFKFVFHVKGKTH